MDPSEMRLHALELAVSSGEKCYGAARIIAAEEQFFLFLEGGSGAGEPQPSIQHTDREDLSETSLGCVRQH